MASTVGELLREAREVFEHVDSMDVVCEYIELQSFPPEHGLYDAVCRSYPTKLQAFVTASAARATWLEDVLELQINSVRRLAYNSWWSSIHSRDYVACQALMSPSRQSQVSRSKAEEAEPRPGTSVGTDSLEMSLVQELQVELLQSTGPGQLSALEVAIDTGDADLCMLLLDSRANLEGSLDRALAKLAKGRIGKLEDVCRLLHRSGVEVESWQSMEPCVQCLRAAATGCTWLLEDMLRKHGMKFEDVVCPNSKWNLTLEAAVTSNHSLMKLALQDGTRSLRCDRSGRSALHYAALQGDEQLLLMMAAAMPRDGLNLDGPDELGDLLSRCALDLVKQNRFRKDVLHAFAGL